MFQEYYRLQRDPFSLNPDLKFLFLSSAHEEAIAHLVYGLEQKEDIISLCGDIGTGKTLAIHRLLDQISGSVIPVFLNVTTIGFAELLRLVLLKLSADPGENVPVATMIHLLEKDLIEKRQQGKSVLLIVDEAQNLTVENLESVRLLLNLAQPGGQVLQIVLAGQLGLQANLDLPQLRQLRQRIKVSYVFTNLNRSEMEEYILHRLRRAGRDTPLFKRDALEKLYEYSGGVPRIVNFLASKALLAGYVDQSSTISAKHVVEAAVENEAILKTEPAELPSEEAVPARDRTEPPEPPVVSARPRAVPEDDTYELPPEVEAALTAREPAEEPVVKERPRKRSNRRAVWVFLLLLAVVASAVLTYPRWAPLLQDRIGTSAAFEPRVEEPAADLNSQATAGGPTGQSASGRTDGSEVVDEAETAATPEEAPALEPPVVRESTAASAPSDSFVVHVASFRGLDRAENFVEYLNGHGWNSYARSVRSADNRTWHRVFLGPIKGRENAREISESLKDQGEINYYRILSY